MKKLILSIILIVGCDETTQPTDCAGVLGGDAISNECGYCVEGSTELHNNYCGNITDHDGNIYKTVKIDEQIWMAENLKVTTALITDSAWCSYENTFPCFYPLNILESEGYSYYDYSEEHEEYGLLYDRDILSYNICPEDWRIPYAEDFSKLLQYIGYTDTLSNIYIYSIDDSTISQKLRITGDQYWGENNTANNISGFSAIPLGIKQNYGNFSHIDSLAFYWNYKYYPNISDHPYYYILSISTSKMTNLSTMTNWTGALLSASVRCIKD